MEVNIYLSFIGLPCCISLTNSGGSWSPKYLPRIDSKFNFGCYFENLHVLVGSGRNEGKIVSDSFSPQSFEKSLSWSNKLMFIPRNQQHEWASRYRVWPTQSVWHNSIDRMGKSDNSRGHVRSFGNTTKKQLITAYLRQRKSTSFCKL